MKINQRLKQIGDLVPFSSCPLDIGCDHALLSIYLVTMRNFSKVVASDNKIGPIESAKENVEKYQVENQVILRLANGLEAYDAFIDTITISGMGGILILQILENGKDSLSNIKTLIISPNNHIALVREKIIEYGYEITEEILVKENKIIYPIIMFTRKRKKYRRKDLFLGPILKNKKEPLIIEYYQKLLQDRYNLLEKLSRFDRKKRQTCKREIKWLEQILR